MMTFVQADDESAWIGKPIETSQQNGTAVIGKMHGTMLLQNRMLKKVCEA